MVVHVRLGRRYTIGLEGEALADFRCVACGFESVARVRGRGVGEGFSPLWLGNSAAKAEALAGAQESLGRQAERWAPFGLCPKCRHVDAAGLAAHRRTRLMLVGLVALLPFAFCLLLHFPWEVGVLASGLLGFVLFLETSRAYEQVVASVTVLTQEECQQFERAQQPPESVGTQASPADQVCPACGCAQPTRDGACSDCGLQLVSTDA